MTRFDSLNGPSTLASPRQRSTFRLLLRLLSFFFLVLCLGLILLAFLVLDTKPHIPMDKENPLSRQQNAEASGTGQNNDAKIATDFVKRISRKIINAQKAVLLSGSEKEINSAFALVTNTYGSLSGRSAITDEKASTEVSLALTTLGKRFYINARSDILPSRSGIALDKVQIGSLRLPSAFANTVLQHLAGVLLGEDYGKNVWQGIKEVHTRQQEIAFLFEPPKGFHDGFAAALQRLSAYSGQNIAFEHKGVQHYLDYLHTATQSFSKPTSIAEVLSLLMQEARHVSIRDNSDPSTENLSALYALAILIEPGVFRHLVSDLKLKGYSKASRPRLTLAGRKDLAQHFIYSSALHILAQKGVSFSLGELKEIMDSGRGGSGFSFADIAANRAGIRFTEIATGPRPSAKILQEFCASGLKESHFFPSVNALPEGLDRDQLSRQFSDTESAEYMALIEKIDHALASTALLSMTGK